MAAHDLCATTDGQPRIGVLMTVDNGPDGQARLAAFRQGLQQLGWTDGRNIRIDIRWSGGNDATMRKNAAEMVALAPNIILATGSSSMGPLSDDVLPGNARV